VQMGTGGDVIGPADGNRTAKLRNCWRDGSSGGKEPTKQRAIRMGSEGVVAAVCVRRVKGCTGEASEDRRIEDREYTQRPVPWSALRMGPWGTSGDEYDEKSPSGHAGWTSIAGWGS